MRAEKTENRFSEKRETLLSYQKLRKKHTVHHRTGSWLRLVLDEGSFQEMFTDIRSKDPLHFPGYQKKLEENSIRAEALDACKAGLGTIEGIPVIAAELSKFFLMGSMGTAAGEKLAESVEEADRRKLPLLIFSASGGARMQEGMFSLLQMAKTSAAVQRFRDHGGFYISVLTNPTTGGVSASYANLGDVILAEPGALIGFAGPRVIEQTIGEKLPAGFQRAEFQMEHGFTDRVVPPERMRQEIASLLRMHTGEAADRRFAEADFNRAIAPCPDSPQNENPESVRLQPYDRVQLARDKARPRISEFIDTLFDCFTELYGDRLGGEDPAMLGGIAYFHGIPVTVLGHRKGRDLQSSLGCHFGMPGPEGYRKALRLMRQAEKFHRPVITFIDTPGAYPGREAEENGQSTAIAENLAAMSTLHTPVISVVLGEGSSGGALAIGVADQVWMLENAVYSVLSPEGFASILWKDSSRSAEACRLMHMTAQDLARAHLIDAVIPEAEGGIQKNMHPTVDVLDRMLCKELKRLCSLPEEVLLEERYQKYRYAEGEMRPV